MVKGLFDKSMSTIEVNLQFALNSNLLSLVVNNEHTFQFGDDFCLHMRGNIYV